MHCFLLYPIRTASGRALLTAALIGCGLPGQATASATEQQAEHVVQSDSWRSFVSLLGSSYIQEPDVPVIEGACRAAMAVADAEEEGELVDICLEAAVRALPVAGSYTTATKVEAQRMSTAAAPYGTIGIQIGRRGKTGPLLVVSPLANSPAERDGVQPGDEIHEIDGLDITDLPMEKAIRGFRGAPGSLVRLRLTRGKEMQMMTLDVKREIIRISYARSKLIEKAALWVRISHFGMSASQDLARQLVHQQTALQGRTPQALIIDLRNCPGGSLDEVQQALSAFLPAETLVGWSRGRNQPTALRADPLPSPPTAPIGPAWRQVRLIVLVDGKTASGAELFAQALRQHRHAVLVGAKTAGIANIDHQVSLPNGARVSVPRGLMLAADKSSWRHTGLTPDVEFETTSRIEYGAADDPGLARALQLVTGSGPPP